MAKHKMQGVTAKRNRLDLAHTIELMFRNVKSGDKIYIAFSKKTFRFLVYTLGMSIIANIIIVYLIVNYSPILIGGIYTLIYIALLILFVMAILSGLWLVFKGIDIVTESDDFG